MKTRSVAQRLILLKKYFEQGRFAKTAYLLQILAEEQLTLKQRVYCASIGRQSGCPHLSLALLRKRVHPWGPEKNNHARKPSADELAEYAICASMLGAHRESRKVFSQLEERLRPEVAYLEANAALAVFDYDWARSLFERWLSQHPRNVSLRPGVDVRLALCLIRGKQKDPVRALALLQPYLLPKVEEESLPETLFAAQMRVEHTVIFAHDFRKALRLAEELAARHPEHHSVGLDLWICCLSIRLGVKVERARRLFRQLKEKTRSDQDWYGLRQFDLYRSFLLKDQLAYLRYQFGTPFPGMRQLAKERFGMAFPIPSTFDWVPSWEQVKWDSESLPVFDLIDGVYEPSGKSLKEGMLLKLLRVLASDFVSPLSEYVLQECLYPGQPHRGLRSTRQLHTLIHRLRSWLKLNKVPIEVESVKGGYRISPESRIRIRVPHPDSDLNQRLVLAPAVRATWLLIKKKYEKDEPFSSVQLSKLRKISVRSSVYHLQKLVTAHRVKAVGSGPATRYCWQEE